jgi:phage-related tail protein
MLKVGGTARTFGLSTEKTAALADAFIALGKEPEVAGTAINAMLSKLQTANVQEKKFKKALASIGFSASEMGTMVRNDAQGAIMKLLETLEKLDKKRRAEVLTQLFGQEYQDDIGLLVTGLDNYRKALSLVAKEENYAGSVQREFANRSATTANELKLLKNRSDEVQQNFGRGLNPAIKQVSRSLAPVVDSISDWTAANPELTAGIGLVAGGVLALKVAILAQSFAFNKLTESIIKANVALGNFNATQAAGTLASPVGMPDIGRGLVPQIGKSPGRFGKWLGKIPGGGKALAAGAALSGMLGRVPGSKAIGGMFGSIGGGLAKAGGALGKVPGGKVVGGFLKRFGPVGALLTAASLSGALMSGDSKEIGGELGGFGGMLAGGAAGAAVGSVIPGIGTAIGGIIGSIVGGIGGDQLGRVLAEKVESQVDSKTAEAVKPKKDTLEVSMKLDFQGRPQITGVRMNGDKDLKFRADMGMMPE